MSDLAELLKRVEAATGPDRALDASICALLAPPVIFEHWLSNTARDNLDPTLWEASSNGYVSHPNWTYGNDQLGKSQAPQFTASIDAVLALVERKLPDHWGVGFFKASYMPEIGYKGEGRYCGEVWHVASPYTKITSKKTTAGPALAILAALLAALLHEGQG